MKTVPSGGARQSRQPNQYGSGTFSGRTTLASFMADTQGANEFTICVALGCRYQDITGRCAKPLLAAIRQVITKVIDSMER